ncbi:testis-expressed protein 13B [Loxodonta africana]|uniref:testis-expressed protein 13B n=1 Tax=Loxodonta africana TaxID=9785 RepID=UPI0030CC2B26
MALNPEDPCGGFHHAKVADFINEKMAGHVKGPEFYIENMSSSWEEVEGKLRAILENSTVSSEAKEACAWGGLALSVRFARRQSHLEGIRVQWLHDFAKLHRSAAQSLAADLKVLTAQQELERKDAASQLQLLRASLAEVQKEQDWLRWKLFQAVRAAPVRVLHSPGPASPSFSALYGAGTGEGGEEEETIATGWPSVATAGLAGTGEGKEEKELATWWPTVVTANGAGTEGEGQEEEEVVAAAATAAAATTAAATTAAAAAATGGEETDAAGATTIPATEVTQELSGSFLQLLGAVNPKNFTSEGQREGEPSSLGTAKVYFSGAVKPGPTASPARFPVQLPASFTYSYPCPSSSFPVPPAPTPSPRTATFTASVPPQMAPHRGASDVSFWSGGGAQGIDPQEPQRSRRDLKFHKQRRAPLVRRLGDWVCSWCKAVNFSQQKICFRCGRGIWLQKSE